MNSVEVDSLEKLGTELVRQKFTGNKDLNSFDLESIFVDILGGELLHKNISKTNQKIANILQECLDDNVPLNYIFMQLRQYDNLLFLLEKDIVELYNKYKSVKPFDPKIKEKFTSCELEGDFNLIYFYIVAKNPETKINETIIEWKEKEFATGNFKEEASKDMLIDTLKSITFIIFSYPGIKLNLI